MNIHWIDQNDSGPFAPHALSPLIHSLLDAKDPSPAIRSTLRLAHLFLLSNHLSLAHKLLSSLYKHTHTIIPLNPNEDSPLSYPTLSIENFYQTKIHERPENMPVIEKWSASLKTEQWGKYRECTRTGWMLDHYQLPEPSDPHIWRESDEPRILAMCARLLAKSKVQGEYASLENLREAVEVAKKLYALPQVCVSEWDFGKARNEGVERHSHLLYRRLVIECAIRIGDLETAAEMLSLGLRIDGFAHAFDLEIILMIPGIFDVLPILAKMGKEGNPFFIEEGEGEEIVKKIVETIEERAEKGRQWSLALEKVGWKELLGRLSRGAWKVNRREYKEQGVSSAEGILFEPATEEEILAAEEKCGELPSDFKEMVRVANG
jgi:hypothetical protein